MQTSHIPFTYRKIYKIRLKGRHGIIMVLSNDGGGICGIIPATFLAEFEKRTGKPICELFDLIAGTSTGGIIAAGLTIPDNRGKPKYSAKQILSAYLEYGCSVFHHSLIRSVVTLGGLIGPKYSPRVSRNGL